MSKIISILLIGSGVGIFIYGLVSTSSSGPGMGMFMTFFFLPPSVLLVILGFSARKGLRELLKSLNPGTAGKELMGVVIFTLLAIAVMTFLVYLGKNP